MAPWIVATISIFSFLIALFSAFLAFQTYFVSQRPYVGVVDVPIQVIHDEKGESVGMSWQFLLKNTGGVPALMTTEKQQCQLKQGERITPFTAVGPSRHTILIMPSQQARFSNNFPRDVTFIKLQDVFNGKFLLTCDMVLSYTAIGWWWKSKFVYQMSSRFLPELSTFVMDSGFAD